MRSDYEMFFDFPQTPAENEWLEERLETLSAKESIILSAAIQRNPPESILDTINLLATLKDYEIRFPVSSYEDLGKHYLAEAGLHLPELALAHTDMEALGCAFEDSHPGLFVGDYYVMYPEESEKLVYDGTNLAAFKDDEWSVKVKIASAEKPDGVWVRLPDYEDSPDGPRDEISTAVRELGAKSIDGCFILDARCILPEAGNLMEQYSDAAELVYDGNNLGYALDERAQGMRGFDQKLAAVLEYEGCQTLRDVIRCADEIRQYSFVTKDKLVEYATSELKKAGAPEALIAGGVFDLDGFAKESLAQNGYQLDSTGQVYVKLREEEQRMSEAPMMPQFQM